MSREKQNQKVICQSALERRSTVKLIMIMNDG